MSDPKPSVKIRLSVSLTGPGKPRGLVGESFTLTDKPLSEACLSVIAVLRRYYLARMTAEEVAVELQKAAEDFIGLAYTQAIPPRPEPFVTDVNP